MSDWRRNLSIIQTLSARASSDSIKDKMCGQQHIICLCFITRLRRGFVVVCATMTPSQLSLDSKIPLRTFRILPLHSLKIKVTWKWNWDLCPRIQSDFIIVNLQCNFLMTSNSKQQHISSPTSVQASPATQRENFCREPNKSCGETVFKQMVHYSAWWWLL